MERRRAVHQKKQKQAKGKQQPQQQPMKVVYITNPMRFKTSASEFRALVQELTGKDSDVADNIAKYSTSTTTTTTTYSASASSSSVDAVNSFGHHAAGLETGSFGDPMELFDKAFESFPWFS